MTPRGDTPMRFDSRVEKALNARAPDEISTTSWLRMWWLTRFCGYRVRKAVHRPHASAFGRITYANTWWLESVLHKDT